MASGAAVAAIATTTNAISAANLGAHGGGGGVFEPSGLAYVMLYLALTYLSLSSWFDDKYDYGDMLLRRVCYYLAGVSTIGGVGALLLARL